MTLTELQSLLDALKRARYSGLTSINQNGVSMSWASDADLEIKINALQAEINNAGGTATRSRSTLTTFTR